MAISTFLKNQAIETIRQQIDLDFKVSLGDGFFVSTSNDLGKDEAMIEEIEVDGETFFIIKDF